jgi:hypothetical protein
MANAGKVSATLAVKTRVGIGTSTIAGGTVTLTAYALAIVGFIQGARDEATISALAVGTVSLVTVLGGRYGQAVALLLRRSSWGAEKPAGAALTPLVQTGTFPGSGTQFESTFSAAGVTGAYAKTVDSGRDEDDDGPGDLLHPIFEDERPSDPSAIPPDVGDADAAHPDFAQPRTAHAASTGPVSGLNESQRAKAREMVIQAAYLGLKNAKALHYTQGARRWEGIQKKLRAWRGQFPKYADCSSFATWCLWQGLGHFHVRDVVNGENWLAGFTGTQLSHGKRVVHESNIKHGDLALYNGHVAVCVGGGMVISHGSEGGPYLLPLHYRSDLLEVRRFI